MPSFGLYAAASWAKRPAAVIGCRFDCPPEGTSKMNPCRCCNGTFETPVKSGPTSGPLTVSSQVIQLPHGMRPPEQFICVPLRLVNAWTTCPSSVTSLVVVPPPVMASYGVPDPKAGTGLLISWLRTSHTLPFGPGNDAHAVVTPRQDGAVVEDDRRTVGVVERAIQKTSRQVQADLAVPQVRDGCQRVKVGFRRRGRTTEQRLQRPSEEHPAGRRQRTLQEFTTPDTAHGHPQPLVAACSRRQYSPPAAPSTTLTVTGRRDVTSTDGVVARSAHQRRYAGPLGTPRSSRRRGLANTRVAHHAFLVAGSRCRRAERGGRGVGMRAKVRQLPGKDSMKYMIEYSVRTAGLSHDENFANQQALLNAFGKWQPEAGLTVHAFVSHLNSDSGYVLVEADDPKVVASFVSKYIYWNDVDVVPVVDVAEIVAINTESLAWARNASSG